jgi:hypothetical protein
MRRLLHLLIALLAVAAGVTFAQESPQSPEVRLVPGLKPTPWLRYVNPTATVAEVSGTWNAWSRGTPLALQNGQFVVDVRKLPIPRPGRYEYKFVANGSWEMGENRTLFINDDRVLERPPDVVLSARLDARDEINVHLKQPVADERRLSVKLEPEVPVRSVRVIPGLSDVRVRGYVMAGGILKFMLDEKVYGLDLEPGAKVAVAGNFNDWNGSGGRFGIWSLHDDDDDNLWELAIPFEGLNFPAAEKYLTFRFVLDGARWLDVPKQAGNAAPDANGNLNLRADPEQPGATVLQVITERPLNLSESYNLVLDGVADRRLRQVVSPGRVLDSLQSTKELGAQLDRARGVTTYRLFAPRARSVHLCLFTTPEYELQRPAYRRLEPAERYPMWKDEADGVWELSLLGLDTGAYYSFNVDGPTGDGEAFNGMAFLGDPYGVAAAHAHNNSIVIDRDATNEWFGGWTDQDWKTPALEDIVIYEAHVRDLTIHPSSGVAPQLRGTYEGVLASLGTGTGLDHIRDLGCNMVELLPVSEFENGARDYGWGYNTVYFFAPEASYGRQPLKGSQFYEFKKLVNGLHRAGLGPHHGRGLQPRGRAQRVQPDRQEVLLPADPRLPAPELQRLRQRREVGGAHDAAPHRGQRPVLDAGAQGGRVPLRPGGADRPEDAHDHPRRGAQAEPGRDPDRGAVEPAGPEQGAAARHRLVGLEQRFPLRGQGLRARQGGPGMGQAHPRGLGGHLGRIHGRDGAPPPSG